MMLMRRGLLCALSFIALGCVSALPVHAAVSSTDALASATSSDPHLALRAETDGAVLSTSTSPSLPIMLQMADGHFYNPTTGQTAATKSALYALLYPGQPIPPALDAITTTTIPTTTPPTSEPAIPTPSTTTLPEFPLRAAIEVSRHLLESDPVTSTSHVYRSLSQKIPLVFAVWDGVSSVALDADATTSATSTTEPSSAPGITLVRQQVSLSRLQSKGIREYISALQTPGVVVGVYYPLITKGGTKKKPKYQANYVVYTPYSEDLHTSDMVALGKARLKQLTENAYAELRTQQVASLAFPTRLVADAIDPVIPESIVAIEHVDYASLNTVGPQGLDAFYVMLAANPDNAFGYSLSPAGARGLAQFIPSTYASVVRHRPEAHLVSDFSQAMEQPSTAMKAEIVYLDILLQELPDEVRTRYLQGDVQANEFVVAAYNGGPVRVSHALADWDNMIESGPQRLAQIQREASQSAATVKRLTTQVKKAKTSKTKTELKKKLASARETNNTLQSQLSALQKSVLRQETVQYILKYRYVATWLHQDTQPNSGLANVAVVTQTSARTEDGS